MPPEKSTIAPVQPLRSAFLAILQERGFIHQCTNLTGLDARLVAGPIAAYNGFDLTADSLHVGHLIPIMMLRWLQKTGNRPIVLLGGATTRVGDPSFRDLSRPLLDDASIYRNLISIKSIFDRYISFGEACPGGALVNNADWMDGLGYIDFLRSVGTHFSVGRMLSFESVKLRLDREQPLTMLEFNYMTMQAYDFVQLAKTHACVLQLGASDQWGNIVCGVDLGRKMKTPELFGLTAPLLTSSSGAKMGKTASGAVWLNSERLSPRQFWQFWRNIDDADIGRFLRLFTELPIDRIEILEKQTGRAAEEAKIVLADEVTELCHGDRLKAKS